MEDQMNVRNIMIVKRNIDVIMEHVFIKKIIKIKGDYWENKLALTLIGDYWEKNSEMGDYYWEKDKLQGLQRLQVPMLLKNKLKKGDYYWEKEKKNTIGDYYWE
eukprot:170441_1